MARGEKQQLTPEQASRYREVVRLRTAGLTLDEIAERTGYASRSGAKAALDSALKLWGQEAVEGLRTLEGERLEELWRRGFRRLLSNPDMETGEMVSLMGSLVKVSHRKAALFGLDAPRQMEVTGTDGGPIVTDVGRLLEERLQQLEQARAIE